MKAVLGVILGCVLTLLYIKSGYTPPALLRIMGLVKSIPDETIALSVLEDPGSTLEQRQRAIATRIGHQPEYYIEIDNAIGNRFTEEIIRRKLRRKVKLLKDYARSLDRTREYEALEKRLADRAGGFEGWRRRMVAAYIEKDAMLFNHLKARFQKSSAEELADAVIGETVR